MTIARFGFAVESELKAIDQQRLEHLAKLLVLDLEVGVPKGRYVASPSL